MNSAAVFVAFSVGHAARITGLSKSRLTRWDRLGFFSPEQMDSEDQGNPYSRAYTFVDLVGLRTLAVLTDRYRIPLKELKKAAAELKKRSNRPWSEIPLAVVKRKVVFDLGTNPIDSDGQLVTKAIPLEPIAMEVKARAEELQFRNKEQLGKTERHKFVVRNAVVFAGTRIPIEAVRSFIRAGYSDKAILNEYPSLSRADIRLARSVMGVAA